MQRLGKLQTNLYICISKERETNHLKSKTMKTKIMNLKIEAQQQSLKHIQRVGEALIGVFEKMEKKGLIKEWKYVLDVYNAGYELRFRVNTDTVNFDNVKESISNREITSIIYSGIQVIIQPKSAWVDEWEEGKGTIKLEAANVSGHYYTREETVEKFSVEDLLHEIDFLKASI